MGRETLKIMEDFEGIPVFFHGKDKIADRDGVLLWLAEMGLSREKAAERLGVTLSAINQWVLMDGSRPPSRQAKILMRVELAKFRLNKKRQ